MTETAYGLVVLAHQALFGGLLCWLWGSRRDRNRADFWVRFIVGWSLLFVAEVTLVVVAAVRGNFATATLVALAVVLLLVSHSVYAYRRTRRGLTWNRQPTNT